MVHLQARYFLTFRICNSEVLKDWLYLVLIVVFNKGMKLLHSFTSDIYSFIWRLVPFRSVVVNRTRKHPCSVNHIPLFVMIMFFRSNCRFYLQLVVIVMNCWSFRILQMWFKCWVSWWCDFQQVQLCFWSWNSFFLFRRKRFEWGWFFVFL